MTRQQLRRAAEDLSSNALELIKEILIKHDMALIEECKAIVSEAQGRVIGYIHPYAVDQLAKHSEAGERWNTPLSSVQFEGAIKVYIGEP